MTIAKSILALQPKQDNQQLAVIAHQRGPALVLAGPGSGKTAGLCWQVVNLLLRRAHPRDILLCTFTRAAAAEMRQRIVAGAQAAGYRGDLAELRVTTIHSLCHQILTNSHRGSSFRTAERVLSAAEQTDLLIQDFQSIFAPDRGALMRHGWSDPERIVNAARRFFDRIADELIDPQDLVESGGPFLQALGRCNQRYIRLLRRRRLVDFAGLQTRCHRLLEEPEAAARHGADIKHLLVDEWQDTNLAQQRILFRLAARHENICVVGDEDQLIYAFRGANPGGFREFTRRFPDGDTFELTGNYRSHRDIVTACNAWSDSFNRGAPVSDQSPLRRPKRMAPRAAHSDDDHPGVVSLTGADPADEAVRLANLVSELKERGFVGSYDEVALLLPSVRGRYADVYCDVMREMNLPVHRDRTGGDFGRGSSPRTASSHQAGHILLTTIHQAKGREWPVVCAAHLHVADLRPDDIDVKLAPHLLRAPDVAPNGAAELDLARQYFVAFSRAQRLLVLSAARHPQPLFRPVWTHAVDWDHTDHSRFTGQGNFKLRTNRPSSSPGSSNTLITVPPSAVLVLRAGPQGPPELALQPPPLARTRREPPQNGSPSSTERLPTEDAAS